MKGRGGVVKDEVGEGSCADEVDGARNVKGVSFADIFAACFLAVDRSQCYNPASSGPNSRPPFCSTTLLQMRGC